MLPNSGIASNVSLYILRPCFWVILCCVCLKYWTQKNPASNRFHPPNRYRLIAAITGISQITVYLLAGVFEGFGKNSAQFDFISFIGLAGYLVSSSAGTELSRTWLIKNTSDRWTPFILISLFFFVLGVPLTQFSQIQFDFVLISQFLFKWVPLLVESFFATMLSLRSGASAAFIYRILVLGFWFYWPFLPDLEAPLKCFIGILVPVIGISALGCQCRSRYKRGLDLYRNVNKFPLGQVAASIGIFLFTWFVVGLLPFRPLVVASGSMSPSMNVGDIAVVDRVPIKNLRVNDVLAFRNEGFIVMHRVISISSSDGSTYFETQGDANNAPDANLAESNDVEGKVLFTIPKLGQLSLAFKRIFQNNQSPP
jgi:signal peptidase